MLILLGLLLACKAEQLGVELPRGGAAAITAEDLRRDAFALERAPDAAAAMGHLALRLGQMRLHPGLGEAWQRPLGEGSLVCGTKRGAGQGGLLVLVGGPPTELEGALAGAALISLAKGLDEREPPARSWWMCALESPADLDALGSSTLLPASARGLRVLLGPLGGPDLEEREEGALLLLRAPPTPPSLGEVDLRRVEAQVREILARLRGAP